MIGFGLWFLPLNMKKITVAQILGSAAAIGSAIPGGIRAAEHFRAYELVWLIPFLPAFTVTFFWIVTVMVGLFIKADSYKDPKAIAQAKSFLAVFDWLFLLVAAAFVAAGWFLHRFFSA